MKKLLLIFLVFISFASYGQRIQKANTYGLAFNRTGADTLFYLPSDTFTVPAAYLTYPFMARKGANVYIWNTSSNVWQGLTGGTLDTTGAFITSVYRRSDSVFYVKGGVHTFAFKDSTGGSTPTLQQVLTAGSTLTGGNTIDANNNDFSIDNVGEFLQFRSTYNGTHNLFMNEGIDLETSFSGKTSSISLQSESITIRPSLDSLFIDSLHYTLSTTGKKILIRDTATGLVQNIDPSLLGASSYTFTNGLTNSSGTVKLGGTLTEAITVLDGGVTNNLRFQDMQFEVTNSNTLMLGDSISLTGGATPNRLSDIKLKNDTIKINPGLGLLYIDTLTSAVGTKALRYNPTTGLVSYADTTTGGSGGTPAGNYGNLQINRNGAFDTPASDSLDFDAGLNIKGSLSATAIPTGGVDADSLVVVTSAGAFKKRNKATFQPALTANQVGYGSASNLLNGSSKLLFYDGLYPVLAVVGSDPTIYLGDVSTNYPSLASSSGASIYGGAIYKSINFYDQSSGNFMARFYTSTGTIYNTLNGLIISNTLSSPSNTQGSFAIQRTVPYAVTGLNYHGFTDETDFRVGTQAFNSFGSFVKIGNNNTTQDHYAGFQTVWSKDSTNRIGKIYDFVSAVSEMKAGTVDTLYRFKVFESTVTGGIIVKQYGIHIPALTAATTNVGIVSLTKSGFGTDVPDSMLTTTSFKATSGVRMTGLPSGKQAKQVYIDANGTLYSADTTVNEGTYTPTLYNTTNVFASSAFPCFYTRVGDWVHVWGEVEIDATTALTVTELGMSLPIATSITNSPELAGTAAHEDNTTAQVKGDPTNDRAKFRLTPQTNTANVYSFHFSYKYVAP